MSLDTHQTEILNKIWDTKSPLVLVLDRRGAKERMFLYDAMSLADLNLDYQQIESGSVLVYGAVYVLPGSTRYFYFLGNSTATVRRLNNTHLVQAINEAALLLRTYPLEEVNQCAR